MLNPVTGPKFRIQVLQILTRLEKHFPRSLKFTYGSSSWVPVAAFVPSPVPNPGTDLIFHILDP